MSSVKKSLPSLFALVVVLVGSYYLFTNYKPNILSQVRGAKSQKANSDYLDTIPLPTESKEIGRNRRDGFSQITASCPKSPQEVQKFFRSVLVSKGWKPKVDAGHEEEFLSVVYVRDKEKMEVSVLSSDDEQGTVFSISHKTY